MFRRLGGGEIRFTRNPGALLPEWWGASGALGTDTTSAVQACFAAALALASTYDTAGIKYAKIELRGQYEVSGALSLDQGCNIEVVSSNGPHGSSDSAPETTFKFTQGGNGDLIRARSSQSVSFRGVKAVYSNPAFTGRVLNGDGVLGADTTYLTVEKCQLGGSAAAHSATFGVTLERAISSTVRDSGFFWTDYGVGGCPSGGAYSNSITVEGNTFLWMGIDGIFSPDEGWLISRNTFEQRRDGKACGMSSNREAVGPVTFLANWFGDNSVAGKPYIAFQGQGLNALGNMFGVVDPADGAIQIGQAVGALYGINITGNVFLGGVGVLAVGAAQILDIVVVGNAMASGTLLSDPGGLIVRKNYFGNADGLSALAAVQDQPLKIDEWLALGAVSSLPSTAQAFFGLFRGVPGFPVGTTAICGAAGQPVKVLVGNALVEVGSFESDGIHTTKKLFAGAGLAVGNSTPATTPGAVVKKMQVFDAAGNVLGYVPIYDNIA